MTTSNENTPGSGAQSGHDQADLHTYDSERHLPSSHNPLPALNTVVGDNKNIDEAAFVDVQQSAEFQQLRKRFRGFAFPMTAAFLIWYFAYVLLSVYAKPFMSMNVGLGNVNMGHVLGILQFVTTFLITWLYMRFMNRTIDPMAAKLRAELEGSKK